MTENCIKVAPEYSIKIAPPPPDGEPDPAIPQTRKVEQNTNCDDQGGPAAILQFSTAMYYVKEGDEEEIAIDVMRMGDSTLPCSCSFETKDGSAKAGKRYVATRGELSFEQGETMKQIKVPIISDDAWDATLEFEVHLSQAKNAVLGRYLFQCRVKVIDDDAFPTNRFGEQVRAGRWDSINLFKLLLEYFKMNYTNPVVRKGTLKVAFSCQISNFYLIWKLNLGKALIDKVLSRECPKGDRILGMFECPQTDDERHAILAILAILLVGPFVLVHFEDFREVHWKIGGTSRKTLQANLLRKYLHYDTKSRDSIKTSDLTMVMGQETFELVSNGYMQIFPLITNIGRLTFLLALQLFMAFTSKTRQSPRVIIIPVIVVIFFPLPLVLLLALRNAKSTQMRAAESGAKISLLDHVDTVLRNFPLIADYQKRPEAVDDYEKKIGKYNEAATQAAAVNVNNKYAAPWLATLLVGVWFMVGGGLVLKGNDGGISLGQFLTTMAIFGDVGNSWSAIYNIVLTLQDALVPLQSVVMYMNLPTDLEKRMLLNRQRRKKGEEARKLARASTGSVSGVAVGGRFAADLVPIKAVGLSYSYDSEIWSTMSAVNAEAADNGSKEGGFGMLRDINFEFAQGELIALVGQAGNGKSTLLKLLGAVLLPHEGTLLVPPHLRVLHICSDPLFFKDTLYGNLTYGLKSGDADASPTRALSICKSLGVQHSVLEFVDAKSVKFKEVASWNEVLSLTQRALLNLARGLMANPEILVIHKPALVFDDSTALALFKNLKKFVEEKGFEMDAATRSFRRPRTCIITTSRAAGVQAADRVFHVSRFGIREVSKEEVLGGQASYAGILSHASASDATLHQKLIIKDSGAAMESNMPDRERKVDID